MAQAIDNIRQKLLAEAQAKVDKIEENTEQQARGLIDHSTRKAMREREDILAEYRRQADTYKAQQREHLALLEGRQLLEEKDLLVQKALHEVYDHFVHQSDAEYLAMLGRFIDRSQEESGGKTPVILVPASRLDAVREVFSDVYSVRQTDIATGFILAYPTYDLNYDMAALMHFWQEELEAVALRQLFPEGEHHEAPQ